MNKEPITHAPLLVHRMEMFHRKARAHGLQFGRSASDPDEARQLPAIPMWIVHPTKSTNESIALSLAPPYPREGGRSYEDSLYDYVQTTAEYYLDSVSHVLPLCPYILAPSKAIIAGVKPITIKLHIRSIAELPEFEVLYQNMERIDNALRGEEFLPGVVLSPGAPSAAAAARESLLKEGFYLVVEREYADPVSYPMIVRVERLKPDGIADCLLFWLDQPPVLRRAERLFRRLLPSADGDVLRETLIATVLSAT